MRFGRVPESEAKGAILAHSIRAGRTRVRKGRCLTDDDLATLSAAGHKEVTVARLENDDLGEDVAASRMAGALVPDPDGAGLRLGAAATGRVNLYATGAGLLTFDPVGLTDLNRINPMMTLATLPLFRRLEPGMMAATIKIISYGVPAKDVEAFAALAGDAGFRCRPPRLRRARLIETLVPGQDDAPKGRSAVKARLDRLGVELAPRVVVPHDVGAVSEALSAEDADLLLVLTGSATSDPDDVGPAAVRRAGGMVDRFGMPVDPGNLLFVGQLGSVPVVGLPGCARSPALNGADWVLERLICGLAVSSEDIAAMGVGGLLKEPPSRPSPRGDG